MDERGVSPVIGVVMMVAIVVLLSAVTAGAVFTLGERTQPTAPMVQLSHELVDDGGDDVIAVTLESGDAVRTDSLYVVADTDIDIGGPPGSGTPANEAYASSLERFNEATTGNPPQVGIGEAWESGETVYLDPVGTASGVRVGIYWNPQPVKGNNPGSVEGQDTYQITEFTV